MLLLVSCGCLHFPLSLHLYIISNWNQQKPSSLPPIFLLNLLKIKDIHTLHLSFIAFQYFCGAFPLSFSELLELFSNVSPYETRKQDDVLVPSTPVVHSDFGLIVAVGHAWNSILVGIRRSCTIGSFKKQLKKFWLKKLINLQYWSVIYIVKLFRFNLIN